MYDILLAALLGLVYLGSRLFYKKAEKFHYQLIGFGSGTLLAIIFLVIIPEMLQGYFAGNISLAIVLLGFTFYYLVEKYIYAHAADTKTRNKELQEMHIGGFVLDNIIIGLFIYILFHTETQNTYMIFLPFLLHVISASILLNHMGERSSISAWDYVCLCLVLPASTLVAAYFYFAETELLILLPFLTGLLLYFVVRDALPTGKKGKPLYFALGVIIVFLIVLGI